MTSPAPVFTVIMATWGRGRHILPSIRSVLQQEYRDFELFVIGDACSDETETVVRALDDPRLRWLNLAARIGSQSGPNNAGIAEARGKYIAYLGHDDIWEPNHLQTLAALFATGEPPAFGVSGAILHLPNGLPGGPVTGVFTDDSVKHTHFFPPSSFAHRKDAMDRIGPWRLPGELRTAVDRDLLRRAAAADLRFSSTGAITVHKFTSTLRYLSYLRQESYEQLEMLAEIVAPGHAERVAAQVEEAKRRGNFMLPMRDNPDRLDVGQIARQNAKRRGLLRPELQPLGSGRSLRQRRQDCALDWSDRPFLGIRMHLLNPRPRVLLPFSATCPVMLLLRVVHPDRAALLPLELLCDDAKIIAQPGPVRQSLLGWTARYRATITLAPATHTILEFRLTAAQQNKVEFGRLKLGFGIGRITLRPIRT